MIKQFNKTTVVSFSAEKRKATISVQAHYNQLILQQIATEKLIGEPLKLDDAKELPKVICDFQNVESIEVVIAILEKIKKNISKSSERGLDFAQAS